MSGHQKICPVNTQFWPDIVRWPAVICSPGHEATQEYFYSPFDGVLVHSWVALSIDFVGTHLYIWVERGTVRVQCLARDHNAMSHPEKSALTTHRLPRKPKQKNWEERTISYFTCNTSVQNKRTKLYQPQAWSQFQLRWFHNSFWVFHTG